MEYITLSRSNGITSKGSPYVTLKLANLEETITLAVWDVAPTQGPAVGQLVRFLNIRDNAGKKSANLSDMMPSHQEDFKVPSPEHPLYSLIPRPIERAKWDDTIQHLLSFCKDDKLKDIIQDFSEKLYAPYSKYPAATSVHHAFPGGLLNHTWQMLHMFEGLYPVLPYDDVKPERVILAVLFHDYGKVFEYNKEGETQEAMYLLGHIYISAYKLHDELKKHDIDEHEASRIVHCVLAHHGQREWGSPVMPCMQEAVIVTYLDNLSAKTDAITNAGHMEKVYALDTHVIKS
ncbi:MAG: HD domain-containing protein [Bacteroidaceae bacterium]|nr:HD domain-containing protein [Bacteroidaceae bacterium]